MYTPVSEFIMKAIIFTFLISFSFIANAKDYIHILSKHSPYKEVVQMYREGSDIFSVAQDLDLKPLRIVPRVHSDPRNIYFYKPNYQEKLVPLKLNLLDYEYGVTDLINIILLNPEMKKLVNSFIKTDTLPPPPKNVPMIEAAILLFIDMVLAHDTEYQIAQSKIKLMKNRHAKAAQLYLIENKSRSQSKLDFGQRWHLDNILHSLELMKNTSKFLAYRRVIPAVLNFINACGKNYPNFYKALFALNVVVKNRVPRSMNPKQVIKRFKYKERFIDKNYYQQVVYGKKISWKVKR